MHKPFDVTLSSLIDDHIPDWGNYFGTRAGIPLGLVKSLDTNLSVTAHADKLFRIDGLQPACLHLEFESSGRLGLPEELLRYNILARSEIGLPVHSVVILLRPKANATDLTGHLEVPRADGAIYLTFRYTVVRLWEESIADLMRAGPGIAPLSVLTHEASADLPHAFELLTEYLKPPVVSNNIARSVLGSTFVLCGLRYSPQQIADLYRRVSMSLSVEDSTSLQFLKELWGPELIGKGEAKAAREMLLRLGRKRFGPPPENAVLLLSGLHDVERLERMVERVLDATGWADILAQQ